ncbi:hypothetical protein P692DRAFT_2060568 [Suillus brevipes Sb2]|nr:hypothetical protein P692DRAFT_2060568 [Suillus brevipes Sb2]
MFFCHFWLKQVLADINSVQKAVLKYCADNTNPLTQEERSSFLNEYSSLLDVWWSEGTSRSALAKALNECEELKLRIERACSRHQEEIIRRRLASPAATTIADTDSTHVPSTKLVDPNPTITTVDPRTQVLADIDSVLEAIFQ